MSTAAGRFRNALITGASGGIGRGLAVWFATQGVRVYAAARRLPELEKLRDEVGDRIVPVHLDVSDAQAVRDTLRACDDACADTGGLDLVIANAAIAPETPAATIDFAQVESLIDVNVTGAAATLTAVLDRMIERGRGHLVGMSSLAAMRGLPRNAAYSASKAFLSILLEGLRVDLQDSGVAVTAVHPGFVKTPGTAMHAFEMPFALECDDAVERIARGILAGASELTFPWQSASTVKVTRRLPNSLWDRLARRFDPRGG